MPSGPPPAWTCRRGSPARTPTNSARSSARRPRGWTTSSAAATPPPPATCLAASSSARRRRGCAAGPRPPWSGSSAPAPARSGRSPPASSSPSATASTCGKRPPTAARPSPRPCGSGRWDGEAAVSAEALSPTPGGVPSSSPAPASQGPAANGHAPRGTVYLLHFDQRYEHAGHYTGWADDLDQRLAAHQRGAGARLVEVITQAGIGFRLARIWPGASRARERSLKNSGGASRYCPICQDERKARGEFRRPGREPADRHPNRDHEAATRALERHQRRQPTSEAVPTRGVRPSQARQFMALNPSFARPVSASLAEKWGRVRGREEIEALGPRVTGARFEENQQLSQQRTAAITRRAVQARAVAARAHQRLANGERERAGGRPALRGRTQPTSNPREGGHER